MKITVAGRLGSGKSTVSKRIAEYLHIPYYSTGSIQRAMAEQANLSTLELNKQSDRDASIDQTIDDSTRELGRTQTDFILDSRMAWHFVERSFKLYLYVDPAVSAERIFHDTGRIGEGYSSVKEALISILEREQCEIDRFQRLYQVDITAFENYDAVIDTSFFPLEQLLPFILALIEDWIKHEQTKPLSHTVWLSPKLLYPTQRLDVNYNQVSEFRENMPPQELIDYPNPVAVIRDRNDFYIYDKHLQAARAIQQRIPVVPCILPFSGLAQISGQDQQQFIHTHCTPETVATWENGLDFLFHRYPDHFSSKLPSA